jgi:FkbM family methyltransferase
MQQSWIERLKVVVARNRPRHKPQLWEDFPLAVRRRLQLELGQRTQPNWLDTPHIVDLSRVGAEDSGAPTRMSLMLRDSIARALFLYGTFEISGTRLMQAFLMPGMTFVDVGANIGYYTLLAARAVRDVGRVYAFEPNAAIRPRLEENLRLNQLLDSVQVYPHAVTRASGQIRFYPSITPDNSGVSSILPGAGRSDEGEVISCMSLDDFRAALPGSRRIDLMKIDVEGAELEVLAGAGRILAADQAPAIMFESRDLDAVGAVLRSYGYAIRRLDYTLAGGLGLVEPSVSFQSIFDDYEPPNYFAAKDAAIFRQVIGQGSAHRSTARRLLGRL